MNSLPNSIKRSNTFSVLKLNAKSFCHMVVLHAIKNYYILDFISSRASLGFYKLD